MSKYIMRDCCATLAALAAEDDALASANFKINNCMVDKLEISTIDETKIRVITLSYPNNTDDLVKTNAPVELIYEASECLVNIEGSVDMSKEQKFDILSEYVRGKGYIWEGTSVSQIVKGE